MNQKPQHPHSPMQAAMSDLAAFYGAEHPKFDACEHARELNSNDTRLESYWEWVVHQIEAEHETVESDIQKARNTVWVNVRPLVDVLTKPDDEGAAGLYAVHFSDEDSQLPISKRATIALDCFHAHQGVDALHDFDIAAVDGGGHLIELDEDHEDASCPDNADVEKYSDKVFTLPQG